MIGATQNSHRHCSASAPPKIAVAVERAGLSEAFETGIATRWNSVSASPIAIGAKPAGQFLVVTPMMTIRNSAVMTTSISATETSEKPVPPYRFEIAVKLFHFPSRRARQDHIEDERRCGSADSCATMKAGARLSAKRPPATRPSVTAGLKCPPEIWPTAKAIARTDRPTANATATRPADGAENSAAPHTAVTSVNVPTNSAASSRDMVFPFITRPTARSGHASFYRWGRGATGFVAACAYHFPPEGPASAFNASGCGMAITL